MSEPYDPGAADAWDTSPAGALRAAVGAPARDEKAAVFAGEFEAREHAQREFDLAWGFRDGRGQLTARGAERLELRSWQAAVNAGQTWIGVTETEEREIVRRMRAAREAERITASALATRGPVAPGHMDAWRQQATDPGRGVAGPS